MTLSPSFGQHILGAGGRGSPNMSSMRTGADYRKSLRDGRRIWVLGEGLIDDVTTHPATRAMVDEYVAWYDRHFDPAWQATVPAPSGSDGARRLVGYLVPP